MTASAAAASPSTASEPPGGSVGSAPSAGDSAPQVPVQPGRVPAADDAIERVGARPDRLVRSPLPVDEVVPALVAGPAPVRDLVAPVARGAQPVDRERVLGRGAVVVLVADRRLAPASGAGRRGQVVAQRPGDALRIGIVERQRVGRDVVDAERDGRVEGRRPGIDRLPRHVVQQVDRHRGAGCPRLADRVGDVRGPVPSPEAPQQPGIERLRAERDAGHARRDQRRRVTPLVRAGVATRS